MKKTWAIRKDAEGVSPVIATILMVAITVVLAAVLYVMVLGFGGTSSTPAVNVLDQQITSEGYEVKFSAPTADVEWGEVTIQLTDGTNYATWAAFTTDDLTDATPPAQYAASVTTLGSLSVYMNITDLAGNGKMSNGDMITLELPGGQVFASGTTYSVTMLHEPSDGQMIEFDLD
ncbi:MAG TPA: type IV pilin N-terminal domain-containing protein [Thermoplasmata archaeon]|nr:type IV pilin N-terminal domain-containing protein [Thermoplasmata archaeon]